MKKKFPINLVGAGPGDPDLLTVKAQRLMGQIDVVVYDKLVSKPILALLPPAVELIFAGKQASNHYMPQAEINQLLVDLFNKGRKVMRLKGGDPFVFGRGGEEALHLAKKGIPFEIVPGITSSTGCAAYAGIPLTHRDLAHGVRFVTGHMKESAGLGLNWESMADPDTTLVIYMGVANVSEISERLIAAGLSPDTPAAVINHGTRKNQKLLTSTLYALPSDVASQKFSGPTLMIIGRVVELARHLTWFANTLEEENTYSKN